MADFPIVGIGSSAGGLEALQVLFRAMPPDSGIAFIIAAHLDPTQKSHLTELLGRCTEMPVVQIENSIEVEPDRVYVIAPDQELTIKRGAIRTNKPREPRGHRHPVDSFFRSLAEDQGERAIAIVLSGTGTNGSLGMRFIKAKGGIAIAQDPNTAAFQGMPRSAISTGLVDLVLAPDKMPEALIGIAGHVYIREPAKVLDELEPKEQLRTLLSTVRAQSNLDFTSYKKSTLLRRINRRMGLHRIDRLGTYVERLRSDPDEVRALTADLTINVTGFFREPEAWKTLGDKVIAPLVRERPNGAIIRVWVPGCSTGEEAYSVSMLILEHAEAVRKTFDVKLFATDIAETLLAPARSGAYPSSIEQDVTPERLERWFDREDDTYRVKKVLRDTVTFAPQNILQDPPFSRMDLVTCRNLLIYIVPDIQKRLLGLFHFALREEGHLFLGPAETISGHEDLFETLSRKWRIYRRIGQTRHDLVDFPLIGGGTLAGAAEVAMPEPRERDGDVMDRALIDNYAPASALIDRQLRVLYLRGAIEKYLRPASGEPSHHLISMARQGLQSALRTVVHRAIERNQPITVDAAVRRDDDALHPVKLIAVPARVGAGTEPRLLVSFFERDQAPQGPAPTIPQEAIGEDQLQADLNATREDLRLTVEQLEVSNEELKASNEEIRSMNEELQASNEELETAKEELQSLNEELNTVNSQLQAKVGELEQRTDDLNNLLNSSDVATLFLDRGLCIRWFTPSMKALLELLPTDIGRPLSHFAQRFSGGDLVEDARNALSRLATSDAEVVDEQGRWYIRHIVPYRTADDRLDGVVVTFTEITGRKRTEEALRASEERLRRVLEIDAVGVIFFDREGVLFDANEGFLRTTGYSWSAVKGRELTWRKMTPPEWVAASEEQMRQLEATSRIGPYEKELFRKDGSRVWMLFAGADLGDGTVVEYCIDIGDRKRVEQERELLALELSHRIKNTLAVVQSLAMRTNHSSSVEEYRDKFVGRLQALSRAHSALLDANWRGADLKPLVEQALQPYRVERPQAIAIDGEPVPLTPSQGLGLSLVLHELATNAVKHGALSQPEGCVDLEWWVEGVRNGSRVHLAWQEHDGPAVGSPKEKGFGTQLIERACTHELEGEVELDYAPGGLRCEVIFPLP